jgi:hypothetical protein
VFWALLLPVSLAGLKMTLLHRAPLLSFLRAAAYGLAVAGVVLISYWAAWIKADKRRAYHKVMPFLRYFLRCKPVRGAPHATNCVLARCPSTTRVLLCVTVRVRVSLF